MGSRGEAATFGTYARRWLAHQADRVRPITWGGYRYLLEAYVLPELADVPLSAIDRALLERWYGELQARGGKRSAGLAPRTVGGIHAVVVAVLKFARASGAGIDGAAVALRARELYEPKGAEPPRLRLWSAEQVRTFLHAASDHRLWPLWAVAVGSGLRVRELSGLAWSDVEFDAGRLHVRRTLWVVAGRVEMRPAQQERQVALDRHTVGALARRRDQQTSDRRRRGPAWINDHDLVFTDAAGLPLAVSAAAALFREAQHGLELPPLAPADLRDTHAALLLAAGVPLTVVSARLGHRSLWQTHRRYAQLIAATDVEAAAGFGAYLSMPPSNEPLRREGTA